MNPERTNPKTTLGPPFPSKAGYFLEGFGQQQTSSTLRDFLRPRGADIRFDVMEIPQGDETVAQLVEEACLKYPSIQLTGFSV